MTSTLTEQDLDRRLREAVRRISEGYTHPNQRECANLLTEAADAIERRGLEAERLREALERISRRAKTEPWPDHYAAEPPEWAKDPFNGDDAATCGYCGAWLTVVRPGKFQCDCCSDGQDLAALARQALGSAG